jgi:hypothetical protein
VFLTPSGSADFWWTLVALLGLIGMQAVYWLLTHPVNKFWLEGENLDRSAIPGAWPDPVTTPPSQLAFRKHPCDNTPLTGTF